MNKYQKENTLPVILGADLGAYSMAVSFAEAGVHPSAVFARDRLAISASSALVRAYTVRRLDDCDSAVPELISFAKKNKDKRLILIPAADWYMEMLQYARDALSGHYFFMIPPFEVWRAVSDKASFTHILDTYRIRHPRTEIFSASDTDIAKRGAKLSPPFVVKPSDSSEYYRHKFPGMKKVYFAHSLAEAQRIIKTIYDSGYGARILLQEYVGKDGISPSVLTVFIGSDGRAKRAVLGDVALEHTSPTARGNYSAIVTRPLDKISYELINMLEGIGYRGFANFDILHEGKESYCLELNPRQGRSFDYTRGAGFDAAGLLMNEMLSLPNEERFGYGEYLWRAVSRGTVIRLCAPGELSDKVQRLLRMKASYTPYSSKYDMGFLRRLYVGAHLMRSDSAFKKEYGRKEMI